MEHLDPDQLVLLALGERTQATGSHAEPPVAGVEDTDESVRAHLQECAVCRSELSQLARTVELAREAGELGVQAPPVLPASIWSGIAQELGIGTAPDLPIDRERDAADPFEPLRAVHQVGRADEVSANRTSTGGRRRRTISWRRGLLAAALVAAVGVGIGTGVVIGGRGPTGTVAVQGQADLAPVPDGPPTAHGTATIMQTADGLTLNVAARQLPLRQGYYEVWLYNPTADKMVAVGMLGATGDGVWTLAPTIDLSSYSIVNVSAQDFDGNPAHKDSVLQGPLTQ